MIWEYSGKFSLNCVPSEWILPSMSAIVALSMTATIFGITSPLRTNFTLSPIEIFNLSTSPELCKVTFSTVTPDTVTGATLATGVTVPVRPTCQSTSIRTVLASSGGNFHARAHRG